MGRKIDKILLVGNPNVGKSALFSRLTGIKVIVSNYPGTTVEFSEGTLRLNGKSIKVIDVPGVYSLEPTSRAEGVALKILQDSINEGEEECVVINVVDATNLERNLNLTLQLIKKRVPMIIALNFWDETKHKGVEVDIQKLAERLGVPVVPTCAISGEGIKQLVEKITAGRVSNLEFQDDERWKLIGEIVNSVQKLYHHHHTLGQRLSEFTIKPATGFPLAIVILGATFALIRFIGESLIGYMFDPIFEILWKPVVMKISLILGSRGLIHDILIGQVSNGEIDFMESFGLLTTGLYVPLAAVLPYVFSFYFVLSILEDSGYLPRLAVLMDKIMHKVGLHGYGIVPTILGFGCNVPGALSTRILQSERERFLAATLMAIAVPCAAQTAMIIGLTGKFGIRGIGSVFLILFIVWFTLGMILNRFLKGPVPELFIEIPPYRIPYLKATAKKVWMRVLFFLREALPWVLFGVLLANILYISGVISFVGKVVKPVISGVMGLPQETVTALIVGFLRKDVAVGMLVPLHLSLKQTIIASVILTMYFPCVATFTVLLKEFGIKGMAKAAGVMLTSTFIVGAILNLIL